MYKLSKSHKALKQKQIDDEGFLFCEICESTTNLSVHHIVYKAEAPKHPNLHHPNNLIMVCQSCHDDYHAEKESRKSLVEQRKLWEQFPKILLKYKDE